MNVFIKLARHTAKYFAHLLFLFHSLYHPVGFGLKNILPFLMHALPKSYFGFIGVIIRLKVSPSVVAYSSVENCVNGG